VLVAGARTSTPASHDVQNGVPLASNFTPVVSREMPNRSPGTVAANAKQRADVVSLDNDSDYCLPR